MPASPYIVRASANRTAELLIYSDIGQDWWGESVAAADFVREIAALDVDTITLRLNSYGGSVSDGIAIYNAIKRHPAKVTTCIDGIAASIASLIAMAGDSVEMAENATLMIHAPWGYVSGNSAELRQYADMLDVWAQAMATSYAAKTGKPVDEMLALLTDGADHWYTAEQALAGNFIDATTAALPIAASARYAGLNRYTPPAAIAARLGLAPSTETVTPEPAAAGINPQEHIMPNPTPAATQPTATDAQHAQAALAAGIKAEADRRDGIKATFAKFAHVDGVATVQAECEKDTTCTVQAAGEKLLAVLARGAEPVAGHFVVVEDERDKARAGIANAVMARAGLAKADTANQYRGYTLAEMARASLERNGVKTGHMDRMSMVAAAFTHSSSDFTNLLANVAEKSMLKGYEEADETFQLWTSEGVLTDFKPAKRVGLGLFPALDNVAEGAEYKYGTVGDRGETIQLATYGKMFSITRQAIINDDLSAFTKIPARMGRAAIRTIGDLVYAILTSNPNMSDGVALFHATHNNLLTGAAISTAAVDAMRVAMGKQTDSTARALNIRLGTVLVPLALQGAANVVRDSEFEVGLLDTTNKLSNRNNSVPNSVRGTFDVIADARLDTASATNWYGAGNPTIFDTIEVAYLDGVKTPTLEQEKGWNVDGVEFKVRLDAGVKALDFRALAKNPN